MGKVILIPNMMGMIALQWNPRTSSLAAVTIYDDCRMTYSPLEYKKICPHCRRESTYLAARDELNIKKMEPC
jgi:hypothetical protein